MRILTRFITGLLLATMLIGCAQNSLGEYYCYATNQWIEVKNEWGEYSCSKIPDRRYQTLLVGMGSICNLSGQQIAIEQNRVYFRSGAVPKDGFILAPHEKRNISFSGQELFIIKSADGRVRLGVLAANALRR